MLGVYVLPFAKKQLRAKATVKHFKLITSSSTKALRTEFVIIVNLTNRNIYSMIIPYFILPIKQEYKVELYDEYMNKTYNEYI